MYDSSNPYLLPPICSESNSQLMDLGISHLAISNYQPIPNPHKNFLKRTVKNCPLHLTGHKRTQWLKTGRKAQHNQALVSNLELFHWPQSHYDSPIHIHHRTPESHIRGILNKISAVRLYNIDTESDKPTRQHPHPLPALIQIQAIHDEIYSTVIVIEVQHLPHSSTLLFRSIQELCRTIFSSTNKIMAWGEVKNELLSFEQFNLFDISQITNTFNLQKSFAYQWNKTHPHTNECVSRHQPIADELPSDDFLVCLVNSDDLNDDFDHTNPDHDHTSCICPIQHRPYKTKNPLWSLQKAVQFVFNQALDKSLTFNIWSCGLDLSLNTWRTDNDQRTRQALISYAINDLFASTNLFFYFDKSNTTSTHVTSSINLCTIQRNLTYDLPLFFVLSDSHGKYLPTVVTTPYYKIVIKSISGLQWVHIYNSQLCAKSLLSSSFISSFFSSCIGVLLLIGTNSVRNSLALNIIDQVENFISLVRSHHTHLTRKSTISIVSVFPCSKPSSSFPLNSLLSSNIHNYNQLLKDLSLRKNFSVTDLPITPEHLSSDGMHVHYNYLSLLTTSIRYYFDEIISKINKRIHSQHRSRIAINRRNKKGHEKLKQKQKAHTVVRPIHRIWKLKDLKAYHKHKHITYNRLPEIYNHQLRIQFNNSLRQQHAEQTLTLNDFDEKSYCDWISRKT